MNQFDPTYGLEVLLIIALAVFSIIILTLMILLYAPRLRRKTTSTISAYSRESRTTSLDSDLESFYIPGPYAGYLKFQKSRNGRVYQDPRLIQQRNSRHEQINSTYMDDVEKVSVNKYFPGLKELSRISSMSPDDLMFRLQYDYETYAKMRQKIQSRQMRQQKQAAACDSAKLKSILKKSTSDIESTLNPSFNAFNKSYVV